MCIRDRYPVEDLERAANGKIDYKRWTTFAEAQE